MSGNYRSDTDSCPICGKPKKYWYELCFECNEKEIYQPRCEVCGKPVQEGHYLCAEHWHEKQDQKQKIKRIDYVKEKKVTEYKEKFEGIYYFNSQMIKSKSELLICYFLFANGIHFQYEREMNINNIKMHPDFVIEDQSGHIIILEHFGMNTEEYNRIREEKEREYNKLCKKESNFYFVWSDEDTIRNIKDRLGEKLNTTPLKRPLWK